MELKRLEGLAKSGYTSFGSMWEKGKVSSDKAFFSLKGEKGDVPVQSKVLSYWPDGSVKWACHTALSDLMGEKVSLDIALNQGLEEEILISEDNEKICIEAGKLKLCVCKKGNYLFKDVYLDGKRVLNEATCEALIESRIDDLNVHVQRFVGVIENAKVVEKGSIKAVIKFEGVHVLEKDPEVTKLPFSIYMEVYRDSSSFKFTHTLFIDIDEEKEAIKGVGINFVSETKGPQYNRHVKALVDNGVFHEAGAMLLCWHPRVAPQIYRDQILGKELKFDDGSQEGRDALKASMEMPVWDEWRLFQDSSEHFLICKKTGKENVCYIDGLHGHRAKGVLAYGSESGSITLALKDFWQKYPSTLAVKGLSKEKTTGTIWLIPPDAKAMDFRHYDTRGYSQTYYEGFDVFGASAIGIANTCEYSIGFSDEIIPDDDALDKAYNETQYRALYMADPEYYHELRAFGFWSLRSRNTEAENWLENQLDAAFEFYKNEVEVRKWYGMFNYGDFMHTYDSERHSWRYDMGGYAWQNTELVPTFWLWFYFLRTQRVDAFILCEAMTRHCSEVDVYHFGKYKGLGSRHNVRHWGCPCKEPRIAMAGHDRMYYYLTGDPRILDIFEEVKDADFATIETDPLRFFFDKKDMVYPTHARTGPDWSSFCSNWLTWWEVSRDEKYREKICTGIEDLKKTKLKLLSGTDFEYDPKSSHLRYIGDRATGGSHLSICQGSEQTWLEMTLLLDDPEWDKMLADYGCFYPLSNEEQNRITGGLIGGRQFSYPFMAAGVIAYGAHYYKDERLGKKVWEIIKDSLDTELGQNCIETIEVKNAGNQAVLNEIPKVSTNVFAQWCLNVMVALEFAKEYLPESF